MQTETVIAVVLLATSLATSGCVGWQIDSAISRYQKTAPAIQLGDSKEKVLAVLMPTQEGVPARARKSQDAFKQGNDTIEVVYFRSVRQPDNLTTDDEFTPYVFKNGTLVAIGWAALGGPKSQGQVVPQINMEQNVTVR
jgi:hypothetical protein